MEVVDGDCGWRYGDNRGAIAGGMVVREFFLIRSYISYVGTRHKIV